MKILLLTHAYNCLCQRLHIELRQLGHDVSIEFDINDEVCIEAIELFQPQIIIAPFLKRAIPAQVWQNNLCWIIHPGIVGDRGASSLDWAILNQERTWGVTLLQANAEMDGGDIWASETFAMRVASKSSIYRQEVTSAALKAVKQALNNYANKTFKPSPLAELTALAALKSTPIGQWRALMTQTTRAINWQADNSDLILRKIHAADGSPGLLTSLFEEPYYLFNASIDRTLSGTAGSVIALKDGAIAIATIDAAVWVSHLRKKPRNNNERTLKLPASLVLKEQLNELSLSDIGTQGYKEVWHHIQNNGEGKRDTAYLHFNFYNGAMSTAQCKALLKEYQLLSNTNVSTIILMGGSDFWSNGIHLNMIESKESAADESWRNINAMNDICKAIIETTDKLTVAAINGNIGAGGVFLALACDVVAANEEVVLNPHYKSMGNLFGSEYWTYVLPKRLGKEKAKSITQNRLPIGAIQAKELGLIDFTFSKQAFLSELKKALNNICAPQDSNKGLEQFLEAKKNARLKDEAEKPLQQYRDEELAKMKLNFYGFDPSYHLARYHFVYKLPKARTPYYIAKHRQAAYC